MFCPICKGEFRDGFTFCARCEVDLVEKIESEPVLAPEFIEFEEVMATYNPADIAFLKSILDSDEIDYFFKGEHFSYMRPLADPVRLMVRKEQADLIRELLKDLKLSYVGINLPDNEPER